MKYLKNFKASRGTDSFVKLTLISVGAVVILESARISQNYRF
jgi:hypothetical protein